MTLNDIIGIKLENNRTLNVNDIICIKQNKTRRVWKITGIHLGGIGEESLISLKNIDRSDGCAYGKVVNEMILPLEIITTNANIEIL